MQQLGKLEGCKQQREIEERGGRGGGSEVEWPRVADFPLLKKRQGEKRETRKRGSINFNSKTVSMSQKMRLKMTLSKEKRSANSGENKR